MDDNHKIGITLVNKQNLTVLSIKASIYIENGKKTYKIIRKENLNSGYSPNKNDQYEYNIDTKMLT